MTKYYYLVTSLPPLQLNVQPEMSYKELYDALPLNLSSSDMRIFHHLLEPIDLYNIKALWLSLPLDEKGTFSAKELEEALLIKDHLPKYLIDFLEKYESIESRLHHFPSLYASLYRQEFPGFLGKYFAFEREIRLVLTALRAKKLRYNFDTCFQFEDPTDPFVAQILAQKDMPEYVPPLEYEELKTIFLENQSDPKSLYEALLKFRFTKVEELVEREQFTLDRILAYTVRLIALEGYMQSNQEKANAIVEELSRYG